MSKYLIHLIVETEDDVICELSTTSGISDLEENLVRKAEHSIKKYEEEQIERELMEIER